jgi:hypothetical protein
MICLGLGDSSGYFVARIAAAAEARLTPAVENSVDEMVCHVAVFGYLLMTLFAFPLRFHEFRLINCSCHLYS